MTGARKFVATCKFDPGQNICANEFRAVAANVTHERNYQAAHAFVADLVRRSKSQLSPRAVPIREGSFEF